MLKKENPLSRMRCKFLGECTKLGISSRAEADMTECMDGKTDEEKELLAEQLIEIITTSATEEEMVERSRYLG